MPRQARKHSQSGIYHVMLRGNNQQEIFEDIQDRRAFMKCILTYRAVSGFQLYAYCLMGNHVHLLIKVGNENLDMIFRRVLGKYVYWYNTKYQRTGHLFQDRFKSEPVDNDAYFLTVLRYIHQNPVKAGICETPEQYRYSSYQEYLTESKIVDTGFVFGMLSKEEFIAFNNAVNDDNCLDVSPEIRRGISDEQVHDLIVKHTGCSTIAEIQRLDTGKKRNAIRRIIQNGASIRQLSRLTGISKGLIEKWLKQTGGAKTGDGSLSS